MQDAAIFVGGKAVFGHLFGCDLGHQPPLAGQGGLANPLAEVLKGHIGRGDGDEASHRCKVAPEIGKSLGSNPEV
jgi:hypothetical protein